MIQGRLVAAAASGVTVQLNAQLEDAVWHEALNAVAACAAANAARAAAAEARRNLRAGKHEAAAAAELAGAEPPAGVATASAASKTRDAAAQGEAPPDAPAGAGQGATAVNAQELDQALRLHSQVGAVKTLKVLENILRHP